MKTVVLTVLAALAVVVKAAENEQKACTAHDCAHTYDLNPLTSDSDYILTSHSGRNFTLNVCRSIVTDLWNPNVARPQDVGGFVRGAHRDISIGKANTTLHVRDGHPVILMTEGSPCPQSDSMTASTAIRFICDKTIDQGKPQLIAQLPPEDDNACAFFIEWRTKHACAVPDRYAYWKTTLMVIVILLALILTAIGLISVHKLIKRRRNAEGYTAPPLAGGSGGSWTAALGERARDLKRLLTGQDPWGHPNGAPSGSRGDLGGGSGRGSGGWRPSFSWARRGRSNFSRLPRSAEEESMMGNGGGPFSVDDDDDDDDYEARQGNGHAGGEPGTFAEESAAWGASRPRGLDASGVIRL